jgi:uncharacterized repeat protein (TIGR03803 family)
MLFTIVFVLALFTAPSTQAQSFSVLYSFKGGTDGGSPQGGLVQDASGNFYGTTYAGGAHQKGVVFKVDPSGNETVLYSFTGQNDAGNPYAGLIMDAAGNLYGTAEGGEGSSLGVVFKLDPHDNFTVLHTFAGADGESPYGALFMDSAGNLYGTTEGGGAFQDGTVFKIDSTGKFTTIYSFAGALDGYEPYGGVIMDSAGNLYGTTRHGGHTNYGTVFKIDSTGTESVLVNFNGANGEYPMNSLVIDSGGNLYGTLLNGGDDDCGTVFKVDNSGKATVLYGFKGGLFGKYPYAGLVMDASSNLYGTTFQGGAFQYGQVFKVDTTGKATFLHSFTGKKDGTYPYAGLILDSAGNLYGTTTAGGPGGAGTVFKIIP